MKLFKNNKSVKLSMPREKEIAGVVVKKVPVGHYIKALARMEGFLDSILEALFPDMSMTEIMATFTEADEGLVLRLLTRMVTVLPKQLTEMICTIVGLEYDTMIEDENIGLLELLEIFETFWELNDLGDFFKRVSATIPKLFGGGAALTQDTGSKDGLQSPQASE